MTSHIDKAKKKKKFIKALVILLELLAVGIIVYLIALPIAPAVKYKLSNYGSDFFSTDWQDITEVKKKTAEIASKFLPLAENKQDHSNKQGGQNVILPQSEYSISPNRVIIPKIGVNAPIIESKNGDYALNRGSWRLPESSTPDKGGNTVITGHRFKYLPPNNLTFYLFHKLETGDIISLIWQKKKYYYKIKQIKIVNSHDVSILNQTEKPTLTLFTCDPIYSQKNRLVVVGELVK